MDPYKLNGFFRGVVEDNEDPLKQGRCRIRVFGIHSSSLSEMNTESLPWSEQAGPLFSGIMQGIGISSVPVNGTWVWVFFERGEILKPVYFASMVGGKYESTPNQAVGFRDKNLYSNVDYKYPRQDRMLANDTDMNRLMTGQNLNGTIHASINAAQVRVPSEGITEPLSTNNLTRYPFNNVIETQAGHGAGKPTDKMIEETTDIMSFTLYNMGLSFGK